MNQRRFVPFADLKDRYGLTWTRQHVDKMVKAGTFPPKIRLTEHRVGWWSDVIEEWIATKSSV
jgi:predicted DNA-binding transcriptional regulator AlpA